MSNEENKKHSLEDLRNQSIDGNNVLGGGSGEIGLTNDFSGQSGVISDSILMDSTPLNQDPLSTVNPILSDDAPIANPGFGGPEHVGPGSTPSAF